MIREENGTDRTTDREGNGTDRTTDRQDIRQTRNILQNTQIFGRIAFPSKLVLQLRHDVNQISKKAIPLLCKHSSTSRQL